MIITALVMVVAVVKLIFEKEDHAPLSQEESAPGGPDEMVKTHRWNNI